MIYTIKDLAEGKVVLLNDGTPEEMFKILQAAFPNDGQVKNFEDFEDYYETYLDDNYYIANSDDPNEWLSFGKEPELPSQSTKVFLKEIESSTNIISDWLAKYGDGSMRERVEREAEQLEPKLIRRFPTGAVRSNSQGRPRPDWISPYAIEEISMVMVDNANDFGAANYLLGIPEEACLESLSRHYGELNEAILIKKDMELARKIARSAGFNIIAMLHTMVLREKGLYNEIFDNTELVTAEEAKKGNEFIN